MRRMFVYMLFVFPFILPAQPANAGMPPKIEQAVDSAYLPAVFHEALEYAYDEPNPSKMRGYAVVERGGIAAARARFFISWQEYDYRGVVIHLDENEKMTTRQGGVYAYLQPGDVMAVTGIKYFNRTVYLKLMSADVYVPENRKPSGRFSRVTVMLGFKFPKGVIRNDDADAVLAAMRLWLRPFTSEAEAKAYAEDLKNAGTGSVGEEPRQGITEEKVKSLEGKIEDAKRKMQESEKELEELRKEMKKRK